MSLPKTFTEGDILLLGTRISDAILADVTDRGGWKQEWDFFDPGIQGEIRAKHFRIITQILRMFPEVVNSADA